MSKDNWKLLVKKQVKNYWSSRLREDVSMKKTMNLCCVRQLQIGTTHPVWDTVESNLTDVRRAITKARLLTGTYILQTHKVNLARCQLRLHVSCAI